MKRRFNAKRSPVTVAYAELVAFEESPVTVESIYALTREQRCVRRKLEEAHILSSAFDRRLLEAWRRANRESACARLDRLESLAYGSLGKRERPEVLKHYGTKRKPIEGEARIAKAQFLKGGVKDAQTGELPEVLQARLFFAEVWATHVLVPESYAARTRGAGSRLSPG